MEFSTGYSGLWSSPGMSRENTNVSCVAARLCISLRIFFYLKFFFVVSSWSSRSRKLMRPDHENQQPSGGYTAKRLAPLNGKNYETARGDKWASVLVAVAERPEAAAAKTHTERAVVELYPAGTRRLAVFNVSLPARVPPAPGPHYNLYFSSKTSGKYLPLGSPAFRHHPSPTPAYPRVFVVKFISRTPSFHCKASNFINAPTK